MRYESVFFVVRALFLAAAVCGSGFVCRTPAAAAGALVRLVCRRGAGRSGGGGVVARVVGDAFLVCRRARRAARAGAVVIADAARVCRGRAVVCRRLAWRRAVFCRSRDERLFDDVGGEYVFYFAFCGGAGGGGAVGAARAVVRRAARAGFAPRMARAGCVGRFHLAGSCGGVARRGYGAGGGEAAMAGDFQHAPALVGAGGVCPRLVWLCGACGAGRGNAGGACFRLVAATQASGDGAGCCG